MNEVTGGDSDEMSESTESLDPQVQAAFYKRRLDELVAAVEAHAITSVTDAEGYILEVNDHFIRRLGYSRDELIGVKHNLLSSKTHSDEFWQEFWHTIKSGEVWQGEICNRTASGELCWLDKTVVPLLDDTGVPHRFVSMCHDVTNLRNAKQAYFALASVDPMTGLSNRRVLIEELDICVVTDETGGCAMVTVAFEDFTMLNDAFGYIRGDQLLLETAKRIHHLPIQPDVFARTEPNVFALVFHRVGENPQNAAEAAETLANSLISVMAKELPLANSISIRPVTKVGYGVSSSALGLNGLAVLNQADIARHRSQSLRGSLKPVSFSHSLYEEMQDRVRTIIDLRKAIDREEFRLVMQPIVDVDQAPVSYELLLRWEHPERGLIRPDEFIPLAEQSGLILQIGEWVIDQACSTLAEWAKIKEKRFLTISVNVSEYQLRMGSLVDTLKNAMKKHGIDGNRLSLEVTESLMQLDIDRTRKQLEEIHALGTKIALDDFGTGFSSLSYLRLLPVQEIKIDRSFIDTLEHDEPQMKLVAAIVKLSHMLGLTVVAEGVETEGQFLRLSRMGVDGFQGYLFGKPAPLNSE